MKRGRKAQRRSNLGRRLRESPVSRNPVTVIEEARKEINQLRKQYGVNPPLGVQQKIRALKQVIREQEEKKEEAVGRVVEEPKGPLVRIRAVRGRIRKKLESDLKYKTHEVFGLKRQEWVSLPLEKRRELRKAGMDYAKGRITKEEFEEKTKEILSGKE